MNKNEALKQIEELKAKISKLEIIVNAPEINPEDLVGKLCYVQNSFGGQIAIVYSISSNNHFHSASGVWDEAQPVPEAEVLKLIYKPKKTTRYDWSKVPAEAKYMYTDCNGDIFWASIRFEPCDDRWLVDNACKLENWGFVSRGDCICSNWMDTEEARPE